MTSIFKVRRIALKAKLNSISCCLLIKLPQLWISKSHQHWLPFMCAWKVRCSRFVCKHWLQPCLSLSCWEALAIYTWAPRALLHHLLPLGHAWHVPGCRAGCSSCCHRSGCRKGHPSLAAANVWWLLPSICGFLQHAGSWSVPLPRLCALGVGLCTA